MTSRNDFPNTHFKFSDISPIAVQALGSRSRGGAPCHVPDYIGRGADNIVFKIVFADSVQWVCRVHASRIDESKAYTAAKIRSTVATMRYIKRFSSIPVPTVFAHAAEDPGSGLGAGYILMEFLDGEEVDQRPNALSPTQENEVYKQLAEITCHLARIRFPTIGRLYEDSHGDFIVGPFVDKNGMSYGPFETAVEFFKYQADVIRKRFHTSLPEDERSRRLCDLYDQVASQLTDYASQTFPLAHGDLGTHNLLFLRQPDGRLILNTVLDWDSAHTSAWIDFGQYPTLLEVRWPAFERGKYSAFVLESILRKQCAFMEGIKSCEKIEPDTGIEGHKLSELIDSAAVRVAEFFLLYGNPEERVDVEMLMKYVKAWRGDWAT